MKQRHKKKKNLTTQIAVRLKEDEKERLDRIKDERQCSASSVMRAAFLSYEANK